MTSFLAAQQTANSPAAKRTLKHFLALLDEPWDTTKLSVSTVKKMVVMMDAEMDNGGGEGAPSSSASTTSFGRFNPFLTIDDFGATALHHLLGVRCNVDFDDDENENEASDAEHAAAQKQREKTVVNLLQIASFWIDELLHTPFYMSNVVEPLLQSSTSSSLLLHPSSSSPSPSSPSSASSSSRSSKARTIIHTLVNFPRDNDGEGLLHYACRGGCEELVGWLMSRCCGNTEKMPFENDDADDDGAGNTQKEKKDADEDEKEVESEIDASLAPIILKLLTTQSNSEGGGGAMPFHYACREGHLDVMVMLIQIYDGSREIILEANRAKKLEKEEEEKKKKAAGGATPVVGDTDNDDAADALLIKRLAATPLFLFPDSNGMSSLQYAVAGGNEAAARFVLNHASRYAALGAANARMRGDKDEEEEQKGDGNDNVSNDVDNNNRILIPRYSRLSLLSHLDKDGTSVLHYAAASGNLKLARYLIATAEKVGESYHKKSLGKLKATTTRTARTTQKIDVTTQKILIDIVDDDAYESSDDDEDEEDGFDSDGDDRDEAVGVAVSDVISLNSALLFQKNQKGNSSTTANTTPTPTHNFFVDALGQTPLHFACMSQDVSSRLIKYLLGLHVEEERVGEGGEKEGGGKKADAAEASSPPSAAAAAAAAVTTGFDMIPSAADVATNVCIPMTSTPTDAAMNGSSSVIKPLFDINAQTKEAKATCLHLLAAVMPSGDGDDDDHDEDNNADADENTQLVSKLLKLKKVKKNSNSGEGEESPFLFDRTLTNAEGMTVADVMKERREAEKMAEDDDDDDDDSEDDEHAHGHGHGHSHGHHSHHHHHDHHSRH